MRGLTKYADPKNDQAFGNELRRRRFLHFRRLLDGLPRPLKVLDIGGTQNFWKQMGMLDEGGITFTLVNLEREEPLGPQFCCIAGDGRDLRMLRDKEFDVVFSNSVIEHVGDLDDQRRMASECMRVGERCYVQTPNKFFPLEPHFLFPCFQFLPCRAKVWLLMHYTLGWFDKATTREAAEAAVRSIRLMTRRELIQVFPGATLFIERFKGFPKSFVVMVGWKSNPAETRQLSM